jgi:hypothetical protein
LAKTGKEQAYFRIKKFTWPLRLVGFLKKPIKNDYPESYIKLVFKGYTGITDITTIKINSTTVNNCELKQNGY